MRFFDEDKPFFTPYSSLPEFAVDCSYVLTDPLMSLWAFTKNLTRFFLWSLPLTAGLIAFNVPLILLSFPIAMGLLTLNIPILIALAVFTSPALYSLSLALYNAVDCIISPIVDILRIISNVSATAGELMSCDHLSNCL